MDTPTGGDAPRLAATGRNTDFILSLDDVAARYEAAGHHRTLRTLQRYCASGHLESQKIATATGDKYLVTPQSVARHIAQIEELKAMGAVATGRDGPRRVATSSDTPNTVHEPIAEDATGADKSRQVATGDDGPSQLVTHLEREVERLNDDREFLREQLKVKDTQIAVKDEQIAAMLERDRETNILIRGLQEGLLLGPSGHGPDETAPGSR